MRRLSGSDGQILKMKLYLLAIGILILTILLVTGRQGEEKSEEPEQQGQQLTEEEPEEKPETKPEIPVPVYNGRIRVLLKTDGFAGEIHETVRLMADAEMPVNGSGGEDYGSAAEMTFSWEEDGLLLNGELLAEAPEYFIIELPEEEPGVVSAASIQRGHGTPAYEGKLEVWPVEEGFILINELPLETYLNYVVPSEMPAGYHAEALKAQAICARTYAYKHLQAYAYPEYRVHVDDSVRFQVYNNTGTAETTSQAVADTAGRILTYQGQPITAYYFSTSCGYTGDEELWWEGNAELTPYLQGRTVNEIGETLEMSSEEVFEAFISQEDETCYDSDISWYRWETEIGVEALSENLNETLPERYSANPEAILTKNKKEFQSISIETIGKIQGIDVLERNSGGAIQKICVRGSKETITAETEYNVRALLNVQGEAIVRKDGSVVEGGAILPSAYFTITPVWDEEGELEAFCFQGGGYGHGAGMSQNGANGMAKQGKSFEEILYFFYTGVELETIREEEAGEMI